MTIARKDIIDCREIRDYHCTARCVRRAFLCGKDLVSNRDFEHRRLWVRDRLRFLAEIFFLEVISYAVQANHLHVILRTRPDLAEESSPLEVASRWLKLYPPEPFWEEKDQTHQDIWLHRITEDPERLGRYRQRLADLSWFMARLDEYIARKANVEDQCTGHFWEGRFRCRLLLDEAALLTCMTYIDLNSVRAGEAKTPEDSAYVSAQERIRAYRAMEQLNRRKQERVIHSDRASGIEIDRLLQDGKSADWLCPLVSTVSRRGALTSVTPAEYLRILDLVGREILPGKRGSIPMELAPILTRLSIRTDQWLDKVNGYDSFFRRILGRAERVMETAVSAGRCWFHGLRACRTVFG